MTAAERRLAGVANLVAALIGLWMLVNPNDRILGPAFDDDVPYGFLVQLDTGPAVVVLLLGLAGLGAAVVGDRRLALVAGGAWVVFAVVAFVALATREDWFDLHRAGNTGLALAVGLSTGLPSLFPEPARPPAT